MNKNQKVSILGDSISTYDGISNNPIYNLTLYNNKTLYRFPFKIEDMWWQKVISHFNWTLLVNNSYSGSSVSDIRIDPLKGKTYKTRAISLHNNEDINPDIIIIYMGVNDLMDNATCNNVFNKEYFDKIESVDFIPTTNNFDESYALMIYNIINKYQNAKIICLNMPLMECNDLNTCIKYNNAINQITNHYGVNVVDLYNSRINDYTKFTIDGCHPNEKGMEEIANCVIKHIENLN